MAALTFKARGFSTLSATSLLLLLVAMIAIATSSIQSTSVQQERARRFLERREKAWFAIQTLSRETQENWDPSATEWVQFAAALQYPVEVRFADLSSRVNLNSVNVFVLGESSLASTLSSKSVQEFAEYREVFGPFVSLDSFGSYFERHQLESLFTTVSFPNVNTVDEIVAQRLVELRTGSPDAGLRLRDVLRQARLEKRIFDGSSWKPLSQAIAPAIGDLFGCEPEINVNTAPPSVLEAILNYPALGISEASGKLAVILSGRQQRRWNRETLAMALGVPQTARVLQYLGTESYFLEGTVDPDSTSPFRFVVRRLQGEGPHPKVRLVWQGDAL